MTVVKMKRDGEHYRIEAKGHATGSVEVCSAVSMLLFTLVNYVADRADYDLKSGHSWVEWFGSPIPYDMISGGFQLLARDYPDYLKIER